MFTIQLQILRIITGDKLQRLVQAGHHKTREYLETFDLHEKAIEGLKLVSDNPNVDDYFHEIAKIGIDSEYLKEMNARVAKIWAECDSNSV